MTRVRVRPGHPVKVQELAFVKSTKGRVDVEHDASPVQADRACQESEESAKLIFTPKTMSTPA